MFLWSLLSVVVILLASADAGPKRDSKTKEICPEVCEPDKCPNVGPIGLSQCPAEQYIVTYRCGCCKKCDVRPVTTTVAASKRDEVCGQMACPKKKVCVLNIQGLPVCKCPTEELCKKYFSRGTTKRIKVCGSDGITYQSRCHLKVASCLSDGKIRVAKKGECAATQRKVESSTLTTRIPTTVSRNSRRRTGKRTNSNNQSLNKIRKNSNNKHNNRRREKKQQKNQNKRKRERNYQRALRAAKLLPV